MNAFISTIHVNIKNHQRIDNRFSGRESAKNFQPGLNVLLMKFKDNEKFNFLLHTKTLIKLGLDLDLEKLEKQECLY